jgi:protein-S-isoprenylcysteine O-methyltransferase
MIHTLLNIVVMLFPVSEVALGVSHRARGPAGASVDDRGSIRMLWIVIFSSIALAVVCSGYRPARFHVAGSIRDSIALALIVGGLALRWTSVVILGRFFTVNVAIQNGHTLVDTGPYKFLRHPSYTGLLLAFTGLGVSFGSWLSIGVLVVPITLALLHRIRLEEAVLRRGLGDAYTDYCARTKRLIPGLL